MLLRKETALLDLRLVGERGRRFLRQISESLIGQRLQAEARPLPEDLNPPGAVRPREFRRQRMDARIEPQFRPFLQFRLLACDGTRSTSLPSSVRRNVPRRFAWKR